MTDLLTKTRSLLEQSEMSLREIAEGAGPPVTYEWLKKFAGDYQSDPTVTRVQTLHDFLTPKSKAGKAA
jgi:transcriptional regulator GlxA family with amidase domain